MTYQSQHQPHPLEAALWGQQRALRLLSNMVGNGKLHHALCFHGEAHSGKTTAAYRLVQTVTCERFRAEAKNIAMVGYCGVCASCLALGHFKAAHVLTISLDDRLPYLRFLQYTLEMLTQRAAGAANGHESKEHLQRITKLFLQECYLLIGRQRNGILLPLKRKKVSYPEGVVLSDKELEEKLYQLYKLLEKFQNTGDVVLLTAKERLEELAVIQNSLDRTYLAKESLNRAFTWTQQAWQGSTTSKEANEFNEACNNKVEKLRKVLIIKEIDKIHPIVVGQFLKILEDPPPQTQFILITSNLTAVNRSVLTPLLSRCFKIPFTTLTIEQTQVILAKKFAFTGKIQW